MLAQTDLSTLFIILFILLLCSAFFSSSETALMMLNRYKMRHLAKKGHKGAIKAAFLLSQPDRLIGLILLGNNFVNILASSLTTLIAFRIGGEATLAIATGLLTLVVLIFAEVTPKTLAAQKPEKIAYPAAHIYVFLLKPMFPLIWLINKITHFILSFFNINNHQQAVDSLNHEELRAVVSESQALLTKKTFLTNMLDLNQISVDDMMIPRHDIEGIDLTDDLDDIMQELENIPYTRIAVFDGGIDHLKGFIHARMLMQALLSQPLSKPLLLDLCKDIYYIPKGTNAQQQLINFQSQHRRVAIIVDEYGDLIGLVTLSDILEEIIGQFTSDPDHHITDIRPQEDGSLLVNGSMSVREFNRHTGFKLSTHTAKTLNGLIIEYLEDIPKTGISLKIDNYPMEILQVQDNAVKILRISESI